MSQTELKNEFTRYTRDRSLFLAFPFLRLSPVTPDNSSIHSSSLLPRLSLSLSLVYAHSRSKNTEAVRKGLFLIRWNYIGRLLQRLGRFTSDRSRNA